MGQSGAQHLTSGLSFYQSKIFGPTGTYVPGSLSLAVHYCHFHCHSVALGGHAAAVATRSTQGCNVSDPHPQ
jgi:hypothetical protein